MEMELETGNGRPVLKMAICPQALPAFHVAYIVKLRGKAGKA